MMCVAAYQIISENAVPSMSFPAPLEAEVVEQITSVGEEPRFSPWISSDRRDEERKLNLAINAAFIFLVVSTVIAKLITVDFDAWRGWTPAEIFLRIPLGEPLDQLSRSTMWKGRIRGSRCPFHGRSNFRITLCLSC